MQTPSTVVLAISRQMGAGGSYIGQAIARRLGLKYLDREILAEATRLLGAEPAHLEQLEERVANTWVRFTRHLSFGPPDGLFTPPRIRETVFEEDLFRIERQIIREFAAREDCVIIGREVESVVMVVVISTNLSTQEPVLKVPQRVATPLLSLMSASMAKSLLPARLIAACLPNAMAVWILV